MTAPVTTSPDKGDKGKGAKKDKGTGVKIELMVGGDRLAPQIEVWAFKNHESLAHTYLTVFLAKGRHSRWKKIAGPIKTDADGYVKKEIRNLPQGIVKEATGISVAYGDTIVSENFPEAPKNKAGVPDYWYDAPKDMGSGRHTITIRANSVLISDQPIAGSIVGGADLGRSKQLSVNLGRATGVTVILTVPVGLTELLISRYDGAQHVIQL